MEAIKNIEIKLYFNSRFCGW